MAFTNERLQQEAEFADRHYSVHAGELGINPRMFVKYSDPVHPWDWRQFGARLLGPVEGKKLLDLGCGMGEESAYFAKLGASVTAIDISPVGIEITRKRAEYNGLSNRVQAYATRADHTEFADQSFDVIHGFGILHHIGLAEGVREVKRLLKPGGKGLFFEHMGNSRLVERLRRDRDYTDYEKPLRWNDLLAYRSEFSRYVLQPFHVTARLKSLSPFFRRDWFKQVDHSLLKVCPALRQFAGGVVIYLEK
jgi:SAM-dependent methyltransferase